MQSGSVTPPGTPCSPGEQERGGLWGSVCWSLSSWGGEALLAWLHSDASPARGVELLPSWQGSLSGPDGLEAGGDTTILALPRPDQEHRVSPTSTMAVFAPSDLPVPILPPPALLSAPPLRAPPPARAGRGGRAAGRGSALASPLLTTRFFSMNRQTVG